MDQCQIRNTRTDDEFIVLKMDHFDQFYQIVQQIDTSFDARVYLEVIQNSVFLVFEMYTPDDTKIQKQVLVSVAEQDIDVEPFQSRDLTYILTQSLSQYPSLSPYLQDELRCGEATRQVEARVVQRGKRHRHQAHRGERRQAACLHHHPVPQKR